MLISTNWLKDYVKLPTDLKVLADQVTKAGINVATMSSSYINHLVIGEIVECHKHPDSDHLNVCMVNVGDKVLQIVCGADNVRKGIKVIVALDGALLPGDNLIKKSIIRGQESNGMICALFELGLEEKTQENYDKGICELPLDVKVGMDASDYLGLSDTVYDLDLNPNRNDCLSHLGFAYEVAAVLGEKVKLPETNYTKNNLKNDDYKLEVKTDNCKLYLNRIVKNVVIKESPKFIKDRLIAAGMRPINNVVDISNYIMLEYGQPLHFFDKDKVGNELLVRMAKPEEKIITLDHKERTLCSDDIVITDGKEPVCIAGVMGGLNSDVDDNTKNILIESAIFNPYNVRYTSINLDLRSEASLRLEKNLNPDYTYQALDRACYLLEKYADGQVVDRLYEYNKLNLKEKKVKLSLNQINSLLGMNLNIADVKESLNKLDFVYKNNKEVFDVVIPNRRMDVDPNKADIIEEIGRLYGFDKIKDTLPVTATKPGKYANSVKFRKEISKYLRALGLNETRTYTLVSESEDKMFDYDKHQSIKVLKPLAADKVVIRRTLIPSLLKVVDYNNARNVSDTNLYEISNVYYDEDKEETKLCIMLKGNYLTNNWHKENIPDDFYVLKGIVESLLTYLGYKNRYSFIKSQVVDMHPGVCADIIVNNDNVGFLGKVHPSVREDDIYVCEISLTKLSSHQVGNVKYKEVSKYPVVMKDLAFMMPNEVTSGEVEYIIKKAGTHTLVNVEVFDLFNIDINNKSIAYSLTFSDPTKTLTDNEINALLDKIIQDVESKTKARLRK
jgi:phenylalanyl-tRNA synthetase beta chain